MHVHIGISETLLVISSLLAPLAKQSQRARGSLTLPNKLNDEPGQLNRLGFSSCAAQWYRSRAGQGT